MTYGIAFYTKSQSITVFNLIQTRKKKGLKVFLLIFTKIDYINLVFLSENLCVC